MGDIKRSGLTPYDDKNKNKSLNLVYVVAGVLVLIAVVFGALHVFGQRFGVPVS